MIRLNVNVIESELYPSVTDKLGFISKYFIYNKCQG